MLWKRKQFHEHLWRSLWHRWLSWFANINIGSDGSLLGSVNLSPLRSIPLPLWFLMVCCWIWGGMNQLFWVFMSVIFDVVFKLTLDRTFCCLFCCFYVILHDTMEEKEIWSMMGVKCRVEILGLMLLVFQKLINKFYMLK